MLSCHTSAPLPYSLCSSPTTLILHASLFACPLSSHITSPFTPTVEELVQAIQAQGLQSIGTVWASQGPEATAAQLHHLGDANAAALFAQLGPDAIASLLRSCGPDFGAQLFLALGAPFAGGLLRHAGTEFSAGLFAALGLDSMVPMLQFMGAEYLSQMMNAAGPATAAGTFKVGMPARACSGRICWHDVAYVLRRECSALWCNTVYCSATQCSVLTRQGRHRTCWDQGQLRSKFLQCVQELLMCSAVIQSRLPDDVRPS